jgi:septum formation protein
MRLILASASPRRAELLQSAGFAFTVVPADIEEVVQPGESPEAYVRRIAGEKATRVFPHIDEDTWILAADTEVVVDGRILGKPRGADDAKRMLRLLSGRAHDVMTAVVLQGVEATGNAVAVTRVWFSALTDREIDWYVASGEPMGKAGGYAIQGLGARFVERIDGSWANVVGLPIAVVHGMLRTVGAVE